MLSQKEYNTLNISVKSKENVLTKGKDNEKSPQIT